MCKEHIDTVHPFVEFIVAWLFVPFLASAPRHTLSSRGFLHHFLLPRHATIFHRVAFSAFSRSYAPLRFRARGFFSTSPLLCPALFRVRGFFNTSPLLHPTALFHRVAFSAFSHSYAPLRFRVRGLFSTSPLPRHATLFHRVAFGVLSLS